MSPSHTKPKVDPAHIDAITAGGNPVIDLDEAHRGVLRASAAAANADAVIAEINAARVANAITLLGGGDQAADGLEQAKRIAGERRRRADALMAKAGIKTPADLSLDMRLYVANQLVGLQTEQVAAEERFANPDLYAVTAEEAAATRHPDAPPPVTVDLLRTRALEGRANIAAHVDWLNAHVDDGPELTDDGTNLARQAGVDALRRFMGLTAANPGGTPSKDDDPALGRTE